MDLSKDSERPPPSYQELHQSTSSETTASNIFADHRRVQEERIRRLLSLYVDPLLKSHAASGIAKAVFVLVPSDSIALQSDNPSQSDVIDKLGDSRNQYAASSSKETLTSFTDDENVRLVRLHGEENSWAFWRQKSVVRELELEIRARYNLQNPEPKSLLLDQRLPAEKRRFWGRKSSSKTVGTGMFSASGGWSLNEQESQPEHGQVSLEIKIEEISLRTITNIGLFDTRSGQALVMRIHIGS